MAVPVVIPIVAAVVQAVGAIHATIVNLSARKDFRNAKRLGDINQMVRALQQRRSFVRAARQAQAKELVQAATSGASLESSGIQGSFASLKTQEEVGVFEGTEIQLRSQQISRLEQKGKKKQEKAAGISKITGGVSDVISAFG